jgi:hypothetical protein
MSNSKCLRAFEDSFNVPYAREKQRDGKHIYVNFIKIGVMAEIEGQVASSKGHGMLVQSSKCKVQNDYLM